MVSGSPIYAFIFGKEGNDVVFDKVEPGFISCVLPLRQEHINSHGVAHGSASATIVDWLGGLVIATKAPTQKRGLSVDIHTTYVSSATVNDTLYIEGHANKVGGRLAFVDCRIYAFAKTANPESKRLIVQGTHTKFVG